LGWTRGAGHQIVAGKHSFESSAPDNKAARGGKKRKAHAGERGRKGYLGQYEGNTWMFGGNLGEEVGRKEELNTREEERERKKLLQNTA